MNSISKTITFHPSSLFRTPIASSDTLRPPTPTAEHCEQAIDRSHSSCSSSSIDTEFTHFRPIRRAPVTGKQMVIARPMAVRTTINTTSVVSSCSSLPFLRMEQTMEEERIKQEKMDCELAWMIHKQEKRVMLRPTSTQTGMRPLSSGYQTKQNNRRRKEHKPRGIRHSLKATLDCELAWRIHKQEKRVMLRQVSTRTQSSTRIRSNCKQEEIRRVRDRNEVKSEGMKRPLRRHRARRKCQL